MPTYPLRIHQKIQKDRTRGYQEIPTCEAWASMLGFCSVDPCAFKDHQVSPLCLPYDLSEPTPGGRLRFGLSSVCCVNSVPPIGTPFVSEEAA
jgi:hypothetical protein